MQRKRLVTAAVRSHHHACVDLAQSRRIMGSIGIRGSRTGPGGQRHREPWRRPFQGAHGEGRQGRSGGYRTVLCLRDSGDTLFFIIFAKKRQANLTRKELEAARKFAGEFRKPTGQDIRKQIAEGKIRELDKGGDDAVTQPDDKKESNQTDMQDDQGESDT